MLDSGEMLQENYFSSFYLLTISSLALKNKRDAAKSRIASWIQLWKMDWKY